MKKRNRKPRRQRAEVLLGRHLWDPDARNFVSDVLASLEGVEGWEMCGTKDHTIIGNLYDFKYIVRFENPNDAVLFKMRWA
jgi:hypothetical protein